MDIKFTEFGHTFRRYEFPKFGYFSEKEIWDLQGAHRTWSPVTRKTAARACSEEIRLWNGVEEDEWDLWDTMKASGSSSGCHEVSPELRRAPTGHGFAKDALPLGKRSQIHVQTMLNTKTWREEEEEGQGHLVGVGIFGGLQRQSRILVRNCHRLRWVEAPIGEGYGRGR